MVLRVYAAVLVPLLGAAALALGLGAAPVRAAEGDAGLLPNPAFDKELAGWVFRPGDAAQASVVDGGAARGKVLDLHPEGKLLGVETDKLEIGKAVLADSVYEVSALLKNEGLKSGVFAFSMYCWDAAGKSLRQISFHGLTPTSAPDDWTRRRGEFGPGTANPLPEGTASICIRFSFYEKAGDCRGKVLVDDVTLRKLDAPTQATAPDGWPSEILADVGDLQVRFESRSFWTLYRIEYQGTRLCLDNWGSHYGTVASFPGTGFIGSGHTENDKEQVVSHALLVDGKAVARPEARYRCKEIRLEKETKVRDLHYTTVVTVAGNRVLEDVVVRADRPTPVKLIYHFMHPWTQTATEYLAELPDGTRVEGTFTGDTGMKVGKPTKWSAIYDGPSGKGAVTYVLAVPEGRKWCTRYWDQPERYRKHYFVTFENETVPAGEALHYRVVTLPFAAPAAMWKEEALKAAAACASEIGKK